MSITITQAKPGRRITVASFEGVITKVDAGPDGDYCVEVTADDGSVSYVYETQLNRVLPYTDGTLYGDSNGKGSLYYYVAGLNGGEGQWRAYRSDGAESRTVRSFAYPKRPMVQVTLGDSIDD